MSRGLDGGDLQHRQKRLGIAVEPSGPHAIHGREVGSIQQVLSG